MQRYGRRHPGTDDAGVRRASQIRELVRLSNALRADRGRPEILAQLVSAVDAATGFARAVFYLAEPGNETLRVAAVAGLAADVAERLNEAPPRLQAVLHALREEFRLSNSYFISHEHRHTFDTAAAIVATRSGIPMRARASGAMRGVPAWHPDDVLLVPLASTRHDRLLGVLSLDEPIDGVVPSLESIEVVELFTSQAAAALDLAALFEEREHEHRMLQEGVDRLLAHPDLASQGQVAERTDLMDLSDVVTSVPAGDASPAGMERLSQLLAYLMQRDTMLSRSVDDLRAGLSELTEGMRQQAAGIDRDAATAAALAVEARQTAASAEEVLRAALEASAIAHEGRAAAEGAALGMVRVRDRTLQAARTIKHLGEMTQQISEIVQTVAQFADETQLLALNAAIEAARAGDQGRGFTIVAQQIRDLATNSAEATRTITGRIKALQQETSAIATTIEESTRDVVEQSDLAAVAGSALGAADGIGQRITTGMSNLSQDAGQQVETAARLSQSIDALAQMTTNSQQAVERARRPVEQLRELVSARARVAG